MGKKQIIGAWVQCGEAPPYNCISIPVRMDGDMPQIKIRDSWYDFPADEVKALGVTTFYGMPVAGIATDWDFNG